MQVSQALFATLALSITQDPLQFAHGSPLERPRFYFVALESIVSDPTGLIAFHSPAYASECSAKLFAALVRLWQSTPSSSTTQLWFAGIGSYLPLAATFDQYDA